MSEQFDDQPESDPADIALHALAEHIRCHIKGLDVLEEWPTANQKLNYPSVTITTGEPKRTPWRPYVVRRTPADHCGIAKAYIAVAMWDDVFQMDLWTRTKPERKRVAQKLLTLFNDQQDPDGGMEWTPDGLSLKMDGNHGELCRYEIQSAKCMDDEAAAQRQERRQMFKVIINFREVRERSYYTMKQIQVAGDMTTSEKEFTDDASDTEISDLFRT